MPVRIPVNWRLFPHVMATAIIAVAATASAQAPSTPSTEPNSPAPPTTRPWRVGPFDIDGYVDGYYTDNANHPAASANGQTNDFYNFNDKADRPTLNAAKLTLHHEPAPLGARVDLFYGRTNALFNTRTDVNYVEQAFASLKPARTKGLEVDLGKFVTSAGAEVVETKDNWNYSRSLLFSWAIPYYHFGLRSSFPASKAETVGVQLVNGWNRCMARGGGLTTGLTSAFTKTRYAWDLNFYTGPDNSASQDSYRNLIDSTLLLTPNAKINAYINYDYSQTRDAIVAGTGDALLKHWQGVAFAAHEQLTAIEALAARFEFFNDPNGLATCTPQQLKEFTGTYEFKWRKWPPGLLSRLECRRDWSSAASFHIGTSGLVNSQSTLTAGFVVILAPWR